MKDVPSSAASPKVDQRLLSRCHTSSEAISFCCVPILLARRPRTELQQPFSLPLAGKPKICVNPMRKIERSLGCVFTCFWGSSPRRWYCFEVKRRNERSGTFVFLVPRSTCSCTGARLVCCFWTAKLRREKSECKRTLWQCASDGMLPLLLL